MRELSEHILDIAQNSVRAKAHDITVEVRELVKENIFEFFIQDNGPGIPDAIFESIKNPFTTSRTMRKVGLGIPLLDDTCRLCGGSLRIDTEQGKGTKVHAKMAYNHIDRPPLGDIISTIVGLITSNADRNFVYKHVYNEHSFEFSTAEILEVLGDDVPLTDMKVYVWMKDFIKENIAEIKQI